jgi:hypothetical protein
MGVTIRMGVPMARRCVLPRMANLASPLGADFVEKVVDDLWEQ